MASSFAPAICALRRDVKMAHVRAAAKRETCR
jgi:hypothetical protein